MSCGRGAFPLPGPGLTTLAKRIPAIVLLVEDDKGDQILTQEAFKALKVPLDLRIVTDGVEAMDYLHRRGLYSPAEQSPRPDLILLDLNMPRMNGQQLAARLHSDPELRGIPIVVLTTSQRQEDVLRAYGSGVASFVGKPMDFEELVAVVKDLESLLRFLLSFKNMEVGQRLTDRQIRRLARRMQEAKHRADDVFDKCMERIAQTQQRGPGTAAEARPPSGEMAPLDRQEWLARTAREILKGAGLTSRPSMPPGEDYMQHGGAGIGDAAAEGLCGLARRLEELSPGFGASCGLSSPSEKKANHRRPT